MSNTTGGAPAASIPDACRRRASNSASHSPLNEPKFPWCNLRTFVFGGQIIRIVTNQGQIVFATDGDGIEVVIKDGTGKVLDTKTNREITFKAGEYNIEVTVTDSGGEQRFVTDHLTLMRGGRKVVDARWEVARIKPTADSSAPGRRAAEWVLSFGGGIKVKENGTERSVAEVANLPLAAFELTQVDLTGREITDAWMSRFQGCRDLTHLNLYGCGATDAGLANFKECRNLHQPTGEASRVASAHG